MRYRGVKHFLASHFTMITRRSERARKHGEMRSRHIFCTLLMRSEDAAHINVLFLKITREHARTFPAFSVTTHSISELLADSKGILNEQQV